MQPSADAKITVIGLGYVGLPIALAFGRSRAVGGFGVSEPRIEALKRGDDGTRETGVEFTCDRSALTGCGTFTVAAATPIDKANRPDLEPLTLASETVGPAIARARS